MSFAKPQKMAVVSIVYWVLLLYMIAALCWWFIALEKQNQNISQIRISAFHNGDLAYGRSVAEIEQSAKRKTAQYIGEGITFFALIVLGAVFVFRAARRQLKLSQQQQNFMMAITHELKTPIAVTQLNLETLQKRKLDEEKQQKLITNTLQEANRLNTLCNNILFASQLDTGAYTSAKQEVYLSDLVENCIDDFKNRFPHRTILEKVEQGIYFFGETLLLQLLINNLVENALKYSPKDAAVKVSLQPENRKIKLIVSDGGNGIPDAEKRKVFDKFYRSGDENTRRTKGTGLGLYLCQKIVESHHGKICITDNHPTGCNFIVELK